MKYGKLARLYAQACMNIFFDELPHDILDRMLHLLHRINTDQKISIVCSLPGFHEEKKKFLLMILEEESLRLPLFEHLVEVMLKNRHSSYFKEILGALIDEYKKRAHVLSCTIKSAQPLTQQQQQQLLNHAATIFDARIMPTWIIDPRLIAGIRIETPDYVFDHSIQKKLRALALAV